MKKTRKITDKMLQLIFISIAYLLVVLILFLELYNIQAALLMGGVIFFSILTLVFDVRLKSEIGVFRILWIILWITYLIKIFI